MLIEKNNHTKVRYLIDASYEGVYAKMQQKLSKQSFLLFSKPERKTNEMLWSHPFVGEKYSKLDSINQDVASALLSVSFSKIKDEIKGDKELETYFRFIFSIPNLEHLYYYESDEGNGVYLTLWGCQYLNSNQNLDVLGKMLNDPIKSFCQIGIQVIYKDGSKAGLSDFILKNDLNEKKLTTNEEGYYSLGLTKKGMTIQVIHPTISEISKQLLVTQDELITLEYPLYKSIKINVVDQYSQPVPACHLLVKTNQFIQKLITNENAFVLAENIEVFNEITVSNENETNIQKFGIEKETDEIIYQIKKLYNQKLEIIVQNQHQQRISNYDVSISINNNEKKYSTNQEGRIIIDVEKETEVSIVDPLNSENNSTFIIKEDTIKILNTTTKDPVDVKVKLINEENKPIQNVMLSLKTQNGVFEKVTDSEGIASFLDTNFKHKEKVKATFSISLEKNNRSYSKFFKYTEDKNLYILKIKKFRWLWLLWLLLLLPLLLLLTFKKNIQVETLMRENNQIVNNAEVNFEYESAYLFKNGSFFYKENIKKKEKSDSSGIAIFKDIEYSLFSYIFDHYRKIRLYSYEKCLFSDSLNLSFHSIGSNDIVKMYFEPTKIDMDFQILDFEDNQQIPNANVIIKSIYKNINYLDSAKTDANGKVALRNIPKCGKIVLVEATAEGYHPERIQDKDSDFYASNPQNRILKLKPIKRKIVFFVINCKNNEPIPDASATLVLESPVKKTTVSIKTNVNGVGKGEYDEVHEISEISIIAEKKYFKKGTLNKKYKVKDFIKLPDSLRKICLEPLENSMDFINIDEKSKARLGGVKNIVTITNGSSKVVDTLISNSNGTFTLSKVISGEKLSILSIHRPNYLDNDYTIRNQDAVALLETSNLRIIPLKPKEVSLQFRTIDKIDNFIVSNVDLKVFIDGKLSSSPTNSGSGDFSVTLPYSSILSIIASHKDYKTNDYTILNKSTQLLEKSPQSARDIPLDLPPCQSGGDARRFGVYSLKEYNMGIKSGTFVLKYYTDSEPDEISVYNCRKSDINLKNRIFNIYTATFNSTNQKQLTFDKGVITVEVRGKTEWNYSVECPNN